MGLKKWKNENNLKLDLMMDWFNQSIKKSKVKLNPFGFTENNWFD